MIFLHFKFSVNFFIVVNKLRNATVLLVGLTGMMFDSIREISEL